MSGPGADAPVALVTGAARGIGAAVVDRLVARGCHVHALDACLGEQGGTPYAQATQEDLDAVVARAPGAVHPVVADVRDAEQVHAAVESAVAEHGRLDHVVAAAAVIEGGDALWETDPALLERLWASDVLGVWHTARASVPPLLEHGRPTSFVVIASTAARSGLWHLSAYCTVKHAVVGLVRGLAADLRESSLSVCAVSPGSTDTDLLRATARIYDLPDTGDLVGHQLLGRALHPDEVAGVVEFASFAGPVVHGSVLAADGGFTG